MASRLRRWAFLIVASGSLVAGTAGNANACLFNWLFGCGSPCYGGGYYGAGYSGGYYGGGYYGGGCCAPSPCCNPCGQGYYGGGYYGGGAGCPSCGVSNYPPVEGENGGFKEPTPLEKTYKKTGSQKPIDEGFKGRKGDEPAPPNPDEEFKKPIPLKNATQTSPLIVAAPLKFDARTPRTRLAKSRMKISARFGSVRVARTPRDLSDLRPAATTVAGK